MSWDNSDISLLSNSFEISFIVAGNLFMKFIRTEFAFFETSLLSLNAKFSNHSMNSMNDFDLADITFG